MSVSKETRPNQAEVYLQAAEIAPGSGREAFLEEACAGHPDLRRSVEELLAAHERPATIVDDRRRPDRSSAPKTSGERPGDRLGNYELIEQIGTGGMGTDLCRHHSM